MIYFYPFAPKNTPLRTHHHSYLTDFSDHSSLVFTSLSRKQRLCRRLKFTGGRSHRIAVTEATVRDDFSGDMDRMRRQLLLRILVWWVITLLSLYRCFLKIGILVARRRKRITYNSCTLNFHAKRANLRKLVYANDTTCFNQIKMYRATFDRLCSMLDSIGGLKPTKNILVDEQVAIFLHILAHHDKNKIIQSKFGRSGETIRRYFNKVLKAMMLLEGELFKKPEPILDDSTDERWKWFKGCLGALDGIHFKIKVPFLDQTRYRNRKGDITTNVLGVCSPDAQFIYVLAGWEGSADDGMVLRDAIVRRHRLKVPQGHYYLVDTEFTNCDGFLAPFRGQRYHLNEWREGRQPTNPREYFNMQHAAARNVIERCFKILKLRWAILRSPSFYPLVRTHNRVILACCLLHNLIRQTTINDPFDTELENTDIEADNVAIPIIEPSDSWSRWRDALANQMFTEYSAHRVG